MTRGPIALVVLVAAIAQPGAAGVAVATATDGATTPTAGAANETVATTGSNVTVIRTGDHAYRIEIGNGSGRMRVDLNLSLFANFPGEGVLRVASVGRLDGYRVVAVGAGIGFAGVGDPVAFLANPFSRFAVGMESVIDLPFLDRSVPAPAAVVGVGA